MKKALKFIGIILLVLILLVVCIIIYAAVKSPPIHDVPNVEFTVSMDSTSIAEGQRTASMVCNQCHLNNGKLEGKLMEDGVYGKLMAPNITNHMEAGIGKYTNGELAYLLRTGINKEGTYVPPWMPKFPNLSDEDLSDIIAFLRSDHPQVQSSPKVQPPSEWSILSKVLVTYVMGPFPYPDAPIMLPDTQDKISYGKYLSTAKLDCFGCHSINFATQDMMTPEKTPGYFGGGNPMLDLEGSRIYSSNLTPDKETGISHYSLEEFSHALKTGIKSDGSTIRFPMLPFPALRNDEIEAIYVYLQTIPAINRDVASMYN